MPKKSLSTIFNQLIKKIFPETFNLCISDDHKKTNYSTLIHILIFKINKLMILSNIFLEHYFLSGN